MTYATQADLIARYGEQELLQLTDMADPPAGVIDATVLNSALEHADGLIDAKISGRYTVPLSPVPGIIVDYASDIARYRLFGNAPPDEVRRRYDDALRFLNDIAAGRGDLGVAAPAPASGAPRYASYDRIFTPATLNDY